MELVTEKPLAKVIPEGYKRTEIGMVPEDWRILKLEDYTTKIGSGITPRGGRKVYKKEGRPFVRSQNIGWGYLDLEDLVFIDERTHKSFDATELLEDDVLLNITGASIGRSAMVSDKIVGGNVNQHVCIIRTLKDYIEPEYLNYFLISGSGQDQVASHQAGGNREGLNFGQIGKFKIPLPPTLEEQQAIAEALSDVDALIAELDVLIEKKQQVKKGAMQQLLTGKKRLPGFEGEWEEKRLGNVLYVQGGYAFKSTNFQKFGVPIIRISNIQDGAIDLEESVFYSPDSHIPNEFKIEKGEALIAMSGATTGKVGLYSHDQVAYQNQRVGKFVVNDSRHTDDSYILHLVSSDHFRKVLSKELEQGAQPNVSAKQLEGLVFNMPNDVEEQKAIANILGDIDAEIQALQSKRVKYEQIKQGMMEELLTGKTRLVETTKEEEQAGSAERKRSWAFEEAVIISTLIEHFSTEDFFPNRFRYVKYSYLLKRFNKMGVNRYLKKAAGPYNPQTRYGGPERIAKEKGYITPVSSGEFEGFRPGDNVEEAINYFKDWYGTDVLDWLEEFRYTKSNRLELLATVDKARVELEEDGRAVTLSNIKQVIESDPDWKLKLKREIFSDENIERAVKESYKLFGS